MCLGALFIGRFCGWLRYARLGCGILSVPLRRLQDTFIMHNSGGERERGQSQKEEGRESKRDGVRAGLSTSLAPSRS